MQILVPGTAVTGVSHHPAEQDVESSQRTPLRAPGQPGWRVKSRTNTLQMFDFPEPRSVQGCHNISAFSLPCSTAAFLPCLFFLLPNIWDFLGDPILSFITYVMSGEASWQPALRVVFCSWVIVAVSPLVQFVRVIAVRCLLSKLAANITYHGLISCWIMLSIQGFPSLGSALLCYYGAPLDVCRGKGFSCCFFASKKAWIFWQNAILSQ